MRNILASILLLSATPLFAAEDISDKELAVGVLDAQYLNAIPAVNPLNAAAPSVQANGGWTLDNLSAGRTLSEQVKDATIGDSISLPGEIDWEKTYQEVLKSDDYKNGKISVDYNAKDPGDRLFFSMGGSITVPWVKKGESKPTEIVYSVAESASARPYRLFATNAKDPNTAAYVDLSGKFVRFFGDPNLINPVYEEGTENDPVPTVLKGLDYNANGTHLLTARYQVIDEETGEIDCPSGQFVLAYYDTEAKKNIIAKIIVEITPPTVTTLSATVGEELRPVGGGYGVKDLLAVVNRGAVKDASDPYSPYLEQFQAQSGEELSNPNHGKIYAIAPTDKSTSKVGMAMPWKADVFWKAPDPLGTMWTFENDWYLITWPTDALKVVTSTANDPGCPWIISTNYTASVLSFREPASLAVTVSTAGEVVSSGAGRYVLKLTDSNLRTPWYLPVEATLRTDPKVAVRDVLGWPVGSELKLMTDFDLGAAEAQGRKMDGSLPAYIHESVSAKIWNAELYHAPAAAPVGGLEFTDPNGERAESPYEKLKSAVYAVNAPGNDNLIELWWSGSVTLPNMTEPITYPGLVERYNVSWEGMDIPGFLPEIVLSSRQGSANKTTAFGKGSLALTQPTAFASIREAGNRPVADSNTVVDVQFFVPRGTRYDPVVGRILTVKTEDGAFAKSLSLKSFDQISCTFSDETVAPRGHWATLSITVPADQKGKRLVVSLGADKDETSAYTVLVDELVVRQGEKKILEFSFDEETNRYYDSIEGVVLASENCSTFLTGAPKDFDGLIASTDGIVPNVYRQNEKEKIGYNPNEEHAFLTEEKSSGKYVVWALRTDLNSRDTSLPYVLVQYAKNGTGAMQAFRVVETSEDYPETEIEVTAGEPMLPPYPIGLVAGACTKNDTAHGLFNYDDQNVVYKDRKNQMWARRDGVTDIEYYYPLLTEFDTPSCSLKAGTLIGWMNCTDTAGHPTAEELTTAMPKLWRWKSSWPSLETIPKMRIGQTLTKAVDGLPEVWNAASEAIVYPNPNALVEGEAATRREVVSLIDPTVVQVSSLEVTTGDFASEYGFVVGPSGTCQLKKGKYYFTGTPPNVSDRFYVDMNADEDRRMCLIGRRVEKESGGSYLQLNILSDEERRQLKAICTLDATNLKKIAWDAAVDELATDEVVPTVRGNSFNVRLNTKEMDILLPSKDALLDLRQTIGTDKLPVLEFTTFDGLRHLVVLKDPEKIASLEDLVPEEDKDKDGRTIRSYGCWASCSAEEYTLNASTSEGFDIYVEAKNAFEKIWRSHLKKKEDWPSPKKDLKLYRIKGVIAWASAETAPTSEYKPKDKYALVANGRGCGYVTLIENDNPDTTQVNEGLPVQMHVIYVEPELYSDGLAVITDPMNKLSEQLTLLYRTPLGSAANDYVFRWRRATPTGDGTLQMDNYMDFPWGAYGSSSGDAGKVSILLGANGAKLDEYVNTYYVLQYQAKEGTLAAETIKAAHDGENVWSDWTRPMLAEGWLQRVLNSVTPFAQRVEDFYSNPSDIAYTMMEQIGKPYTGDVALNNDNLNEVGLLELYRTIFNRAEMLLNASRERNVDMSKQLMLAATRIGEFYTLLGDEAYSDAMNPLVASADDEALPSSTFCFQNQVRTLLDEELALLRGRTSSTQFPAMNEAPYYNRLIWNLTKGITEGEAAYVNNYGIRARNGILDVNCAAAQYPQGHGDAYGHYLSTQKTYYRLLKNDWFDWTAAMGEMLLDQTVANIDYQDEQKFVANAVKLAKTGIETMDLTVRKAYAENDGDARAAYFDADENQAFGYGEWATRTGMGAAYNWMVGNALLPTNQAPYRAFTDRGIMKIDRTTASELIELADSVHTLEERLAVYELGMNPLGFDENTIPFDIDPDQLDEKNSHFEQILERANRALENANKVLSHASVYGSRLARIQSEETEAIEETAQKELAYKNELIAVYGTPYAGDIGSGGTYPQGYDGPDIYNYNYMDLTPYGLVEELQTTFTNSYTLVQGGMYNYSEQKDPLTGDPIVYPINYIVTSGGIRVKPDSVGGLRATEGSIQSAYRDYILAYIEVKNAMQNYEINLAILDRTVKAIAEAHAKLAVVSAATMAVEIFKASGIKPRLDNYIDIFRDEYYFKSSLGTMPMEAVPRVVGAGMAIVSDPQSLAKAAVVPSTMTSMTASYACLRAMQQAKVAADTANEYADLILTLLNTGWNIADSLREMRGQIESAAGDVNDAIFAIQPAIANLSKAEAAYRQEIYKGQMLLEEREMWRKHISNAATAKRYQDMYNRVQRNAALTKYRTSFDLAQRYVWELAKVYDYETGLLSMDPQSGKTYLSGLVGSRNIAELEESAKEMDENFSVLKGRLGINNPDKPENWFSLRYELMRIRPDAAGDEAWKTALKSYWVDDINANEDYLRYCQPLATAAGPMKEPGLVIPFATSINAAENFFGKSLQGGESQFSAADYATKIAAVGVDFVGYDKLTTKDVTGLATNPNVYLVPAGKDYMRAPAGTTRQVLSWNVVDQVMPLPYTIGSKELDDGNWIASFSGLDGTNDSGVRIRRHSTLRAGSDFTSTRLVGRSVWNDKWLLVIPASSLNADRRKGLETFIDGVSDIKFGIKAYSRSGN